MAQIGFYGTFDDSLTILDEILSPGDFRALHNSGAFPEPKAMEFTSVTDELKQLLHQRQTLFLAGAYTHFPPHFIPIDTGPYAGQYAVDISRGGPLMSFMGAFVGEVEEVRGKLLAGEIWYQHQYLNPRTQEWEKPSAELKAAYAAAVRRMKRHLVRLPTDRGTRFIAPEALALLQSGEVTLRGFDRAKHGPALDALLRRRHARRPLRAATPPVAPTPTPSLRGAD